MNSTDPRTITGVLQSIGEDVQTLVRAEIGLVKVEGRRLLQKSERAAVRLVIGVAIAHLAIGFLLLAAVYALGTRLEMWLSALIVGAVAAIAAVIFMMTGAEEAREMKQEARDLKPSNLTTGSFASERRLHHG